MATILYAILSVTILPIINAFAEECYSFGPHEVYPHESRKTSGHRLHYSKALISKPAPYFSGTAVVNGEFRELNLTQFEGKYLVFFFYPLDL